MPWLSSVIALSQIVHGNVISVTSPVPADGGEVSPGPGAAPPGLWRRLRVVALLHSWLGLWPLSEGPDGLPRPITSLGRRLSHLTLFLAHLLVLSSIGAVVLFESFFAGDKMNKMLNSFDSSATAIASSMLMAGGMAFWQLLAPMMYRQRSSLSRLMTRWSRLETLGAARGGRPRAAHWLLPTILISLSVAAQTWEWKTAVRQKGLAQSSLKLSFLSDVWWVLLESC